MEGERLTISRDQKRTTSPETKVGRNASFSICETKPKTNMDYSFPLKDKSAIVIMPSDNKLWNYEAYDYSGVFIGYLGPTEDNPLFSATV